MWHSLPFLAPLLPAQATGQTPNLFTMLVPWVVILLIFYVILWRPAQKKQRQHQQLLDGLKKGDRVITNGGLYGKVAKVDQAVVVLEISDNTRVRVARRAIAGFEGEAEPPPAET